jgi:hypothetical protein
MPLSDDELAIGAVKYVIYIADVSQRDNVDCLAVYCRRYRLCLRLWESSVRFTQVYKHCAHRCYPDMRSTNPKLYKDPRGLPHYYGVIYLVIFSL